MFGNVFYRDFNYKMVTHARVFSISSDIIKNTKVGLYISSKLTYLNKIFSYNNMASWLKIKDFVIKIPSINDEISYKFMEDYISELEEERISELSAYLTVSGLYDYNLTPEEQNALDLTNNINFRDFRIKDLFDIHPTSAYKMTNNDLFKYSGKTPVVTNSSSNNGITGYTNLKPTETGGMITYSDTTTSEAIFYQPNDFIGYSHVQGLYPYNKEQWGEKTLLYFISLFRKSANNRFDYANKFNRVIAGEMIVRLPIKNNNEPDYDFMETYIRAIEKSVIKNVVEWKDKVINTTRSICGKKF